MTYLSWWGWWGRRSRTGCSPSCWCTPWSRCSPPPPEPLCTPPRTPWGPPRARPGRLWSSPGVSRRSWRHSGGRAPAWWAAAVGESPASLSPRGARTLERPGRERRVSIEFYQEMRQYNSMCVNGEGYQECEGIKFSAETWNVLLLSVLYTPWRPALCRSVFPGTDCRDWRSSWSWRFWRDFQEFWRRRSAGHWPSLGRRMLILYFTRFGSWEGGVQSGADFSIWSVIRFQVHW